MKKILVASALVSSMGISLFAQADTTAEFNIRGTIGAPVCDIDLDVSSASFSAQASDLVTDDYFTATTPITVTINCNGATATPMFTVTDSNAYALVVGSLGDWEKHIFTLTDQSDNAVGNYIFSLASTKPMSDGNPTLLTSFEGGSTTPDTTLETLLNGTRGYHGFDQSGSQFTVALDVIPALNTDLVVDQQLVVTGTATFEVFLP